MNNAFNYYYGIVDDILDKISIDVQVFYEVKMIVMHLTL